MTDSNLEFTMVVCQTFEELGLGKQQIHAVEKDPSALLDVICKECVVSVEEAENLFHEALRARGLEDTWNKELKEYAARLPGKKGIGSGNF